jgi:hypothetical protein
MVLKRSFQGDLLHKTDVFTVFGAHPPVDTQWWSKCAVVKTCGGQNVRWSKRAVVKTCGTVQVNFDPFNARFAGVEHSGRFLVVGSRSGHGLVE